MKIYFVVFNLLISLPVYSLTINNDTGIALYDTTIYKFSDIRSPCLGTLFESEIFIVKSIKCIHAKEKFEYEGCFVEIEKNGKILGWVQRSHILLNIKSNKNIYSYRSFNVSKYQQKIKNDAILWVVVSEYDSWYKRYDYGIVLTTQNENKLICFFESENNIKLFKYEDINLDSKNELIIETWGKAITDVTICSTLNIFQINNSNIVNLFKIKTSYSSHAFDLYLNSIFIVNKKILVSTLFFGNGIYHENGIVTFGTTWTTPIKTKEMQYIWNQKNFKYDKISETIKDEIICYSEIDNLVLYKNPNINSKIITKINKGEKLSGIEITDPYQYSKIEVKPNLYGYWLKVKTQNGYTGWAFTYFLKFEGDYINLYMKHKGKKESIQEDDDFIKMNLINFANGV